MNDVASKMPSKWRLVGIQLNLPTGTLDSIQSQNAGKATANLDNFENVLNVWMQQGLTPYTWETIIDVLKADAVGEERLAEKIANKYLFSGECVSVKENQYHT